MANDEGSRRMAGDDAGELAQHQSEALHLASRVVPDAVVRRFLRVDNRYFFADRTLAFVDQGIRLKVRSDNAEVIHSIVAIAQARGWHVVKVRGAPAFCEKLWYEATLQGLVVRGHAPGALEQVRLQRALEGRQRKGPQLPVQGRAPPHAPATDPEPHAGTRPVRDGLRPPVTGILLAHAAAPYRFDPAQRMSYYVRLHTELGERTVWGADLERALAESRSGAKVGDEVVLRQRGARPVTLRVADRNHAGELVGETKIVTQRMGWTLETTTYLESLGQKAALVRNGEVATQASLSRYPDLASAAVALQLAAQFARRITPRADDQVRLVQAIRDGMANALAQGSRIRLPPYRLRSSPEHSRGRPGPTVDDPAPSRV